MDNFHVEEDNLLVEVDNLLVQVGFLLVEVGSGLFAVDNQLVLGGMCMVVVFPPCWLFDERFPVYCENSLLPEKCFPDR